MKRGICAMIVCFLLSGISVDAKTVVQEEIAVWAEYREDASGGEVSDTSAEKNRREAETRVDTGTHIVRTGDAYRLGIWLVFTVTAVGIAACVLKNRLHSE